MKRSPLNQSQTTVETTSNKRDMKAAAKEQPEFDSKFLAMACIFARKFNGECLSQAHDKSPIHVSMVKGQPSLKFKC